MEFDEDAIDERLRGLSQWICWAVEVRQDKDNLPKETKVPRDPRDGSPGADPTDPDTWADFETAVATAEEHGIGIGFCFNPDGLVAGVDLDNCRDPESGEIEAWAQDIIDRLDSWTQVSTSGTGVHIFALGFVPDGGNKKGVDELVLEEYDVDEPTGREVEMYDGKRFFAMTGDHLEGTPAELHQRQDALRDVHEKWVIQPDEDEDQQTLADVDAEPADLSVEELVEKARNAKNGDKFDRLWRGDTSDYPSHSEADQALCNMLAFWTAGDRARMDALFRRSGLMRDKWDEDRGGQTYGEITIESARSYVSDYYEPGDRPPPEGIDPPDAAPSDEQLAEMLDDVDGGDGAEANGGTAAEGGTSDGTGVSDWDVIRSLFKQAHQPGENTSEIKQQARYLATRRLEEFEDHFATNEVSDKLHVYEGGKGFYLDRGGPYVGERLVDELQEQFTTTDENEIIAQIKRRTFHHPDEFGGPPGYVCVANGILEIGREGVDRVIDHTPSYLFQARVETEYDPDATCPRFREFIEEVVPRDEDRKTLQEYLGYTLMNWGIPYARALFIVGPTASGKSTFLDVARAMLGEETVASISPQELALNRFTAIKLWGAWANIRNDIDAAMLSNIGLFKELTAGDPVYVEEKNQAGFTIRPKAKHLYSANQLPEIDTDDDAFYRRIILVTFPHTVPQPERDPHLKRELVDELPGILNWAIEGLARLMENGRFTGDLSPAETHEQWEQWGDSIGRFKANCLIKEVDAFVPKKEAHSAFTAYCDENGLPGATQQKLTRELKRDKDISDAKRTPDGYSRQVSVYTGVRLDPEWEPDGDGGDDDGGDGRRDDSLDSF